MFRKTFQHILFLSFFAFTITNAQIVDSALVVDSVKILNEIELKEGDKPLLSYENGIKSVGEKTFEVELKDGIVEYAGRFADAKNQLKIITGQENLSERDAITKVETTLAGVPGVYYVFKTAIVRVEANNDNVKVYGVGADDNSYIFKHEKAVFVADDGSIFAATPTTLMGINSVGIIGLDLQKAFGPKTPKMIHPDFRNGLDPSTVELRDETFAGLKIIVSKFKVTIQVVKDEIDLLKSGE